MRYAAAGVDHNEVIVRLLVIGSGTTAQIIGKLATAQFLDAQSEKIKDQRAGKSRSNEIQDQKAQKSKSEKIKDQRAGRLIYGKLAAAQFLDTQSEKIKDQ